MAMDMPPTTVIEYRVEKPAARNEGILAKAMALAMGPDRTMRDHMDRSGALMGAQPKIDVDSRALTRPDREALVIGMEASREGRLGATGVRMPEGYVAERLRLAMQADRIKDAMAHDRQVSLADARAHRCQVVRTVMDQRAGAYVVGGEKAAQQAREAIPKAFVAECKGIMGQAQALRSGRDPQRVDLQVGASRSASLSGVAPRAYMAVGLDLKAPDRTRLDPKVSAKVRIDPAVAHRPPVRIDPVGTQRVRLDLKGPSKGVGMDVMQAFAASGKGRGA